MKAIIDSDALFAVYNSQDSLHAKAKRILKQLKDGEAVLLATNLVFQESATLVSYRLGQAKARDFVGRLRKSDLKEVFVTPQLTHKTWQIFEKQIKKGTSFVDCANIIALKEFKADFIFSFDKFYSKDLRIR